MRNNLSVLAPSLMLIAEEFAGWSDSNRRIDLLCLDKEACLVVVELKRTEDAGHSELQALRYAAMVSSMTFRQVVEAHARGCGKDVQRAEEDILAFLGWATPQEDDFGKDVRIILAAADFSREVTTSVLWLNERKLDIRCVRLRLYQLEDGGLIIDAQQVIPLPEAADYLTRIADKREEQRRDRGERHELRRAFWTLVLELARQRGAPHGNRSPTDQGWIGGGSGIALNYVARQTDSRFEVYVDRGGAEANLRTFRFLQQHQATIEERTGPLEWDELPDSRACRISLAVPGGYRLPEEEWPKVAADLVEAALKVEGAFRPLIPTALAQ